MNLRAQLLFALFITVATPLLFAEHSIPNDSTLYSIFLNTGVDESTKDTTLIVVRETDDHTWGPRDFKNWQDIRSLLPEVEQSTAMNFLTQPKSNITMLKSELDPRIHILLLSKNEIDQVFNTNRGLEHAWERLRETYPGAKTILRFSAIGYNESFTQAVFVVSMTCGSLCGSGHLLLMQRKGETWGVVKLVNLWIS